MGAARVLRGLVSRGGWGSRLCSARVSPVWLRLRAELLTLLLWPRSSLHDPQPERPTADVCNAPARQASCTRPLGPVAALVCHEDLVRGAGGSCPRHRPCDVP